MQCGRLSGLGPDGVGYIAVAKPAKTYGFILENLGTDKSFEELGWKDGAPVEFRTDDEGRIREIVPGC